MKNLKNWDKKTWLSSPKYTSSIINFLENRIKFNKEIKILDIGCGRGKIISTFSKKYQMTNLPLGIDIVDHKNAAKKIKFNKINAVKYLGKTKEKFDLILFKQSIHFFNLIKIEKILRLTKKNLNLKGKIIILALHPTQNHWPVFKVFKMKLIQSLKKDEKIFNLIKSNFIKYKINYFKFKVEISNAREELLDFAESVLFKKVREGHTAELIFFLKTKGKSRGYIERQEITGDQITPLFEVKIIDNVLDVTPIESETDTHQ